MRAVLTPDYGPPSVLEFQEVPAPEVGATDVLVEVHATPITAGDRRLRAADFPAASVIPGRLMMGVTRPKNPVQGSNFAGRVVQVGPEVTRFAVGDDVFGSVDHGANAQLLSVAEDGRIAILPAGFSYAEAAALPYGAGTALHFLTELTSVKPGEHVLLLGASGGVGRYAIQIAKHLGAEVTAVCSSRGAELVRSLGADHVIDYRTTDFTAGDTRYDVVFDIADASSFRHSQQVLTETGRYLSLYISPTVLLQMAWTSWFGSQRALFTIALPTRADTIALRELAEQGVIRPVIADRFAFEDIARAHTAAEEGPLGDVVVDVATRAPLRAVG